jgi:hypothetical protein
MVKRLRLLLAALSTVVIVASLWTTQANVMAQSPTKTPIGEPPTKTPLPIEPPTKAPLPTDTPTQTPAPTQAPTYTPQATATATRTSTPRPSATASPTPLTRSPVPTAIAGTGSLSAATAPASPTLAVTPNAIEAVIAATTTPAVSSLAAAVGNSDPPASIADTTLPIITQAMNIGGFLLGVVILGLVIWFGLSRLGRAITTEIHTVSLANLRLQHEAERIDRREKVVFRADSDVLTLLEQAILDASGESVHVRLLPNGWLSSPPLLAVVDTEQVRYLFSPASPEQVQDSARRHGLTQLLLGHATDLTAYPIDALNSTPFIVDDLSSAFGYVLARYQAPRRPLPRTDRWYLYIARPRTSRLPSWFERRVRQTGVLRRWVDRIPTKTHSDSSRKTGE